MQDPKFARDQFDLIIAPDHDRLRGRNIISTIGALNSINAKTLKQAKKGFPDFKRLPSPRIAVLIGGNSKTHTMTTKDAERLANHLLTLQKEHKASLMMTCSRRTGKDNEALLRKKLKGKDVHFWNGKGKNPLMSYLAWADCVIVTSDSVSMISESISSGKPTYLYPLGGGSAKFNRFYESLIDKKYIRWIDGHLENWGSAPVNEAARLADLFKERYLEHVTKSK